MASHTLTMVSQHMRVKLMATCALSQILAKLEEQLQGPGTVLNYLTYVTSFNSHKTMWHWYFHYLQLKTRKLSTQLVGKLRFKSR